MAWLSCCPFGTSPPPEGRAETQGHQFIGGRPVPAALDADFPVPTVGSPTNRRYGQQNVVGGKPKAKE